MLVCVGARCMATGSLLVPEVQVVIFATLAAVLALNPAATDPAGAVALSHALSLLRCAAQSEGDAEIEDELDEADEDMSQPATARSHHRRPPAKQPRPGASDAVARVSVGRPRDKQPPGGNSSATAAGGGAPRTAREAAAAGLRSLPPAARAAAAAAAGGAQGTPKVAPLGATGLSPLLSPGLATLLSADAILAPAGGACMDVHPELVEDHQLLLGDFDFSNDALLAQLPRPNPSMLTSAALEVGLGVGGGSWGGVGVGSRGTARKWHSGTHGRAYNQKRVPCCTQMHAVLLVLFLYCSCYQHLHLLRPTLPPSCRPPWPRPPTSGHRWFSRASGPPSSQQSPPPRPRCSTPCCPAGRPVARRWHAQPLPQ